MSNSMMRMAGRGVDGLSKALMTDNQGRLITENEKQLKQEILPGGKNRFNIKEAVTDRIINATGALATEIGWSTSGLIPIEPNKNIVMNGAARVAEYDYNKKFIPGTYKSDLTGITTLVTTANTFYTRFSRTSGATFQNMQLEYGTIPTTMEAYSDALFIGGKKYTELIPSQGTGGSSGAINNEIKARDVETSELVSLSAQRRLDGTAVLLVAESALPDAAHAYAIQDGTANVQGFPALSNARLVGFTITNNGDVTAAVKLYHGTSNSGVELFDVKLEAKQSIREWFDMGGITSPNGIFVERTSGSSKLTLFARGD